MTDCRCDGHHTVGAPDRPCPVDATDNPPLVLDRDVRVLDGGRVLLGGDPARLLRLRSSAVLEQLSAGGAPSAPVRALGRRLLDAGLAHPLPRPARALDVHVVIPVRDRVAELDRCLSALDASVPVLVVDDGSRDPDAVAKVCWARGADVLRLPVNAGPGAARNAGLTATTSAVVAFLDSDCRPPPGWLPALLGHLADPAVGAVAPRVCGEVACSSLAGPAAARRARGGPGRSLLARYAATRSPLDLGPRAALVRPGSRRAYVPTAALIVRRAALPEGASFDPALRFGEDVDLVWRLHDAGWRVRYDPRTTVRHTEPDRWGAWLARRHRYGTSAAPLAQRHGPRLTPLVLPPWQTAAWLLLVAGRPVLGLAAAGVPAARLYRTLRRAGLPAASCARVAVSASVRGVVATGAGLGGAGTVVTGPLLLGLLGLGLLGLGRTRRPALVALLAPPLLDWLDRRPSVDPLRWSALRLLDDLAYASGVWRGCLSVRTLAPLRPRLTRPV